MPPTPASPKLAPTLAPPKPPTPQSSPQTTPSPQRAPAPAPAAAASGGAGGVEVLRADGLVVSVVLSAPQSAEGATLTFCYGNDEPSAVDDLRAEVAVPRYLAMNLGPPSATSLPAEPVPGFGPTLPPITQTLWLTRQEPAQRKPLKLKLKLNYSRGGVSGQVQQCTIGPETLEAAAT